MTNLARRIEKLAADLRLREPPIRPLETLLALDMDAWTSEELAWAIDQATTEQYEYLESLTVAELEAVVAVGEARFAGVSDEQRAAGKAEWMAYKIAYKEQNETNIRR